MVSSPPIAGSRQPSRFCHECQGFVPAPDPCVDESPGCVFDALHHVLPIAKLAGPEPVLKLPQGLSVLRRKVPHQKPLDLGPLDDQVSQPARSLLGAIQVVLRALAADRHSSLEIEQSHHRVGDRAAQVVEIDVGAEFISASGRKARLWLFGWGQPPRVARGLSGRESAGARLGRWKQGEKTRESGGEEGIRTPE